MLPITNFQQQKSLLAIFITDGMWYEEISFQVIVWRNKRYRLIDMALIIQWLLLAWFICNIEASIGNESETNKNLMICFQQLNHQQKKARI